MKVKCIDNEFLEHSLTIDKIYEVLKEKEHHYEILDNDNENNNYKKIRFVQVDENKCINTRIKCINNYLAEKYLSKDKIYTVLEEKGDYYVIYDDSKKVNNWNKYRFIPVEEELILTIEELEYLNHILQQHKYKGDEISAIIQKKVIEEINKNNTKQKRQVKIF